jgi:hypothetical protein
LHRNAGSGHGGVVTTGQIAGVATSQPPSVQAAGFQVLSVWHCSRAPALQRKPTPVQATQVPGSMQIGLSVAQGAGAHCPFAHCSRAPVVGWQRVSVPWH